MTKGQTVTKNKPVKQSEKKKRGRPPKPLDKERLRDDLENGLTKEEAYKNQNLTAMHATTLEKKDSELSKIVEDSPEVFNQKFAHSIKPMLVSAYRQKVLDGDVAAILYGMRNIVGFTEKRAVEVTGEISHVHSLNPEDRAKRIAQLKQELDAQVVDVAIEANEAEEKPSDSE